MNGNSIGSLVELSIVFNLSDVVISHLTTLGAGKVNDQVMHNLRRS